MRNKIKIILMIMIIFVTSGCKNEKKLEEEKEVPKIKEFVCEEGILENDKCKIITTASGEFTCMEGYTLEDDKCVKKILIDAVKKSSCPDGFELKYDGCISIKNYPFLDDGVSCPDNTTKRGNYCKEIEKEKNEYSCIKGVLNGTTCEIIDEQDADLNCPNGYTKKDKACVKTEYKEAIIIEK